MKNGGAILNKMCISGACNIEYAMPENDANIIVERMLSFFSIDLRRLIDDY